MDLTLFGIIADNSVTDILMNNYEQTKAAETI